MSKRCFVCGELMINKKCSLCKKCAEEYKDKPIDKKWVKTNKEK
jgi:hypothetical protein